MSKIDPTSRLHSVCCFLFAICFCSSLAAQQDKKEDQKYRWKTVSGKVVDADGNCVNGAFVCHRNLNLHPMNHTLTNEQGEFELKYREPKSELEKGWLWAYSPDHNLRCVSNLRKNDHLLKLPKRTEFKITFLTPSGQPLKGAKITPYRYSIPNGVYSSDEDTRLGGILPKVLGEKLATTTNDDGECLIRNVPRIFWGRVIIESEEFGRHILGGNLKKDEYQIAETGSLKVEILPDEPIEFAGTNVSIHSWGAAGENSHKAEVGGYGICNFPHVTPSDQIRISLNIGQDEVYQPKFEDHYTVQAGLESHVKIPIKKTVKVQGNIMAGEKPVPFAKLIIDDGRVVTTDENGVYIRRVFPGRISVDVYDMPRELYHDYETGNDHFFTVEESDNVVKLDPIQIPALTALVVKVIDENDKPVTGFKVSSKYKERRWGPLHTRSKLDDKGTAIAKLRKNELDKYFEAEFHLFSPDMKDENDSLIKVSLVVESKKPLTLRCQSKDLEKFKAKPKKADEPTSSSENG